MPELTLDQALAELPATADGIADRMRALGIKGRRGSACECPLARYLTRLGLKAVLVSRLYVRVGTLGQKRGADTPPAVAEFVQRVDRGVYLDLVAASWPT